MDSARGFSQRFIPKSRTGRQSRLGHAIIQLTLDTYSHVLPTMQRIAAEKMDTFFRRGGGGCG